MSRTIIISRRDYHDDLKKIDLSPRAREILTMAAHAYIQNVIPSAATDQGLKELGEEKIESVLLKNDETREVKQLGIMVYRGHDQTTHRQFAYLATVYPKGTNLPLDEHLKTYHQ